ncbi:hypothetical protein GGF37_003167 [Kickxella alabastrina]|nr:hypothetical protein GGF37_003167 [Kickxella alabastrina]
MQANKVAMQAGTMSKYRRPDSAASTTGSGFQMPLLATGERAASRTMVAARPRRIPSGTSVVAEQAAGSSADNASADSRTLRRYRSDTQARSRSPTRVASAVSNEQQPQSHQQQQPVRIFGASRTTTAVPHIGISGRQHSEPVMVQKMRASPRIGSAVPSAMVPPSPQPMQPSSIRTPSRASSIAERPLRAPSAASMNTKTALTGSSSSVSRPVRPATAVPVRSTSHRPSSPPSSMAAGGSDDRLNSSRIPRLVSHSEYTKVVESRRQMMEQYREKDAQLKVEQCMNNELLSEFKNVAEAFELATTALEKEKAENVEIVQRATEVEVQYAKERAINRELQKKLGAMEVLLREQQHARKPALNVSSNKGSKLGNADWRQYPGRIQAQVAEMHAAFMLERPDSAIDETTRNELAVLEKYIERGNKNGVDTVARQFVQQQQKQFSVQDLDFGSAQSSATAGAPSPGWDMRVPQRRRVVDEEREDRRRSTILFAGLVQPSSGSYSAVANNHHGLLNADSTVGDEHKCERCAQLTDTLMLLERDNDYYREANSKLRDNITDAVSKHNAIVRVFERERQRRRELKSQALLDAIQVATNERDAIEARQRASLEATAENCDLSRHFDRSMRIASPTTQAF